MVSQNITLNGIANFSAFGRVYTWQGKHLEAAHIYNPPPAGTSDQVKVAITGSDWLLERLHFQSQSASDPLNVTLTDSDSASGRLIKRLMLAQDSTTIVTLQSTRVQYIEDGQNANITLNLGSQVLSRADLWAAASVTVKMGTGQVDTFKMSDTGTNMFTASSGWLGYLEMGTGNNTFIGGSHEFGTIVARGAVNTMTFQTGGNSLQLGEGVNNVTLTGGLLHSLYANGDDTISLTGDARILQLKMDEGINRLTTENGIIESIYAYHGQNTIRLGQGGAQQIVLSGSADAQVISSVGWLGSLQIYAGNQVNVKSTTVTLGIDGAGYIQTSQGDDRITTGAGYVNHIETYVGNDKVAVGAGGVGSIYTGDGNDIINLVNGFADLVQAGNGNDIVTTGSAGGHFIYLADGNDTASITAIGATEGLLVDGGKGGTDSVDLSRFTKGLTVSLDQSGNFQEFAAGTGFFLLFDFENAVGTAKGDSLTGSGVANILTGGLGADSLSGLAGDDRLIGGKGNDILRGGLGLDTFVFAAGDGNDRIKDFTLGDDHLAIAGTTKLADMTFVQSGLDVMVSVGLLHVLVEHMTVADLRDVGNFVF